MGNVYFQAVLSKIREVTKSHSMATEYDYGMTTFCFA